VSFGILLPAFATRLAYLLYSAPELHGVYWDLSTSLLRDGTLGIDGRPVAGYEPGYPVFLGLARALTGDRAFAVAILQVGSRPSARCICIDSRSRSLAMRRPLRSRACCSQSIRCSSVRRCCTVSLQF
jgi:hypothetical protein